jgi:hypothetical protein
MDWIRTIIKLGVVAIGLFGIYVMLANVIASTNKSIQEDRDNAASAVITSSYVSAEPFGQETVQIKRDSQIFYNIQIKRTEGEPCYVKTSWRWILHHPSGNTVMWSQDNGEFYAGDKSEKFAQALDVPAKLIPGDYTLSRLSSFKCGDVVEYAKTVRNTDLRVE